MLDGEAGAGTALAMRLVVGMARVLGASSLVEIRSAHVDSCLYHGAAGLDFARRLVDLGASVRVPTTLNVGSVDLLHPGLVRTTTEHEREVVTNGRALMEAYRSLGCQPTFTCAPYQLPGRPGLGEHVAWGESNAIVFANSVLGARTDRYGDFLDIAAALTGRAPYAGLHRSERRRGELVFDCTRLPDRVLRSDLAYPLLGYLVGAQARTRVPVITGWPDDVTEDQLKGFGAAAASSGGVALFHAVGVTPEADTLETALDGQPADTVLLSVDDLVGARAELCTVSDGPLDAISIGTPHASYAEAVRLAELLDGGRPLHPSVACYLSTGRTVLTRLREDGSAHPARAGRGPGGGRHVHVRHPDPVADGPGGDDHLGQMGALRAGQPGRRRRPRLARGMCRIRSYAAGSPSAASGRGAHDQRPNADPGTGRRALPRPDDAPLLLGRHRPPMPGLRCPAPSVRFRPDRPRLVMESGRGSSSSASVLAEQIRTGVAPAAIVLAEPDPVLVAGAMVAYELYGLTLPIVVVERADLSSLVDGLQVHLGADTATGQILPDRSGT